MEKKVFKIFLAWQDQQEEKWLRFMAQQGWSLKEYTYFRYTFEQTEPHDSIYKLDYKATKNNDLDDYLAIYQDAGWEHVAQFAKWHYFKANAETAFTEEIYTDSESQVQKYKGLLKILLLMFFSLLFISFSFIQQETPSTVAWFFLGLIVLYIFAIINVGTKIKRLRRNA
ncbi:hypothetical protein JOC78_001656 [Bacillus ectoiniformans]|uniref:DUF2812 domain-containing protein n=1 Tax=Bacillus ectoiniformans TaxID=1494429 RepID=UPI00195B9440|nr:DUF2812 domain-containing protein [Bacillus ectoiniformans]MBM7648710.1 hypothetical protein [Bacillus ectoiniformans]